MNENVQKSLSVVGYVVIFFFSFLLFVFLSFPYGILKETIVSKVGKMSGLNIQMEDFGPSFPLGIGASAIKVTDAAGGPGIDLKSARVKIGVLPLLIGQVSIKANLETQNDGFIDVKTGISLFRAIVDRDPTPSKISLEAEKFSIGHIVDFALSRQANNPTANPLVAGLLSKIHLTGDLEGTADFDLNLGNMVESTGALNLDIKKAALNIDDPALNLAPQNFSKAVIKAKMNKGKLTVENASGFKTQELDIGMNGRIDLKPDIEKSGLDMALSLKLDQSLKQNFGFLLDMSGGKDGSLNLQIKGSLGAPSMAAQ